MTEIRSLAQIDINGTYSYADYLDWKFEGRIEIIKGKIMPMAAPSTRHQRISWQLSLDIGNHLRNFNCQAFAAPFDVRLLDKRKSVKANQDVLTVVQPDICIICDDTKIDEKGCIGAPDLIVEILSPGNSSKEMRLKKELYEENKVREYWIIDPDRAWVRVGVLVGSTYDFQNFTGKQVIKSAIFPDLKLTAAQVLGANK